MHFEGLPRPHPSFTAPGALHEAGLPRVSVFAVLSASAGRQLTRRTRAQRRHLTPGEGFLGARLPSSGRGAPPVVLTWRSDHHPNYARASSRPSRTSRALISHGRRLDREPLLKPLTSGMPFHPTFGPCKETQPLYALWSRFTVQYFWHNQSCPLLRNKRMSDADLAINEIKALEERRSGHDRRRHCRPRRTLLR